MFLKVSASIEIPESFKETFWVSQILSQLTRSSKNYNNPDVLDTLIFYDVKNNHIKIPRLFNIKNCDVVLDYDQTDGEIININAKWKPRNELQKEGVKYFCTNDSGILKLNPGEGKTIISILSICEMKRKSIIFVHKDSLVSQWKERFLQASDIKEEDIGILETNNYLDVIKKPIVIGTVQTMNSMIKKYPNLEKDFYKANFGIGIWDECHTTGGAPLFSKSIYYIPAKKCFGLSATPSRSDHNDDVIGMHLGKVIEPKGKSDTLKPRVVMTYFNTMVMDKFCYFINFGFPDKNGKRQEYPQFDKNRYLTMLTSKKQPRYVKTVQKIIDVLYKKGRNILVLCDRIKIIDCLAQAFPKEDVGYFLPRTGKDRDKHLHRKIVFSTPGSARDGTDNPDLDCLVLATPLGNLDQAIGRVTRLKEGKPQPIVIDIVDSGCSEMMNWSKFRMNQYMEKVANSGWQFEEKFLK
jgi:superfamily II DNA or RNA helicase